MRYLYTDNATKEYKALGSFHKFDSIQTVLGWVGVIKCNDELADALLEHPQVKEVDQDFYENVLKKEPDERPKSSGNPSIIRFNQTDARPRKKCGVCGGRA